MFLRVVFCMLFLGAAPAYAGAFLQPEGKLLFIQQAISSRLQADCGCVAAKKQVADTTVELGLTSFLTVLGQVSNGRRIISNDQDDLYPPQLSELGARVALWRAGYSIVSGQVSMRAQDMSTELRPGLPLRELRLMFGHSFNTDLGPGFLSFAPGLRAGAGRPKEGHLEVTGGLTLSGRWQALAQLHSLWRGWGEMAAGGFQHRTQFSLVFNPGRNWSLQAGVFSTPLASGLARESGLLLALWRRF